MAGACILHRHSIQPPAWFSVLVRVSVEAPNSITRSSNGSLLSLDGPAIYFQVLTNEWWDDFTGLTDQPAFADASAYLNAFLVDRRKPTKTLWDRVCKICRQLKPSQSLGYSAPFVGDELCQAWFHLSSRFSKDLGHAGYLL